LHLKKGLFNEAKRAVDSINEAIKNETTTETATGKN
jgi:hypothetical protein